MINELVTILKAEHLDTEIIDDVIHLHLGLDHHNKERHVLIKAVEQVLQENIYRIEMISTLNIAIKDSALIDLQSTILYLNRLLEYGAFEFDYPQGVLFFRATHLSKTPPDKKILLSIVGIMGFYLALYSQILESVAVGNKTFTGLLEELLEAIP